MPNITHGMNWLNWLDSGDIILSQSFNVFNIVHKNEFEWKFALIE